jgi:hypothetical protein
MTCCVSSWRVASADWSRCVLLSMEFSDELASEQSGWRAFGGMLHHAHSHPNPAGAVQLVQAFHDGGLPRGMLNLVFGQRAPALSSCFWVRRGA